MVVSLALSPFEALNGGLWWIVLTIFCACLGNLVGFLGTAEDRRTPTRGRVVSFPHLATIVAICLVGTAVYWALSPVYVFSAPSVKPPLAMQFVLACLYALPLFCGLLFASATRLSHRLLGVSNFAVALIMGTEFAGRSTVLMSVALWGGTYLCVNIMRSGGRVKVFTRGRAFLTALVLGLIVLNLVTATIARGIQASQLMAEDRVSGWRSVLDAITWETAVKSVDGLQSSTVGSIASFTWWFAGEWDDPNWSMAYLPALFSGPLEQFGLLEREALVLEATFFDDGSVSNVYTLFRPIIQAFTLPGSLVVLFGVGLLTGWAYRRVAAGHPGPMSVLFMFYACVMVSGGIFFGYNSIDLAYAVVVVYLIWCGRIAASAASSVTRVAMSRNRATASGVGFMSVTLRTRRV
jgi:hypothetical protein